MRFVVKQVIDPVVRKLRAVYQHVADIAGETLCLLNLLAPAVIEAKKKDLTIK